ncbi:ARID DNA-binding domain-containing protein [Tanacetum coccineum]
MVISKYFLEKKWSRPSSSAYDQSNNWYQSKCGRSLRKRPQYDFIQRKLRREKEAQIGTCIRQITQDCKEMLRKKMEEIKLYNSTINQPHLVYMFKDPKGQSFNEDKLRIMHNKHLEEYFESLDRSTEQNKPVGLVSMEDDVIEIKGTLYSTRVTTFNEYVGFLNLVKQDEIVSQEWDKFRNRFDKVVKWFYNHYLNKSLPGPIPPIINDVQIYLFDLYKLFDSLGGYLGVYFGNEFGKIGEILGLSKQDGEEIKRCYINYLDVFTSYYKTARVTTRNVEEGNGFNCLTSHQSDFAEIRTPNVEVAKGKEKMEHFGIELEDTSYESDNLSPIHPSIKGRQTMSKDNQGVIKGPIKLESEVKEDSNSSSSEDFTIVA